MKSPFTEGRYEYDAKHLFYLPANCFAVLERPKPTFLIGSRGSGKTTLLKALSWDERLENESLIRQLGGKPFAGRYIGCYLKLPKIQLNGFDAWLRTTDEDTYRLVFGFYLDLIFVELVGHAITNLLAGGQLRISPNAEEEYVRDWLSDLPEPVETERIQQIVSMPTFCAYIRNVRRELERHANRRTVSSEMSERYSLEQVGTFSTSIAKQMALLCEHDGSCEDGVKWHFKICMEEGECLNPFQQKAGPAHIKSVVWQGLVRGSRCSSRRFRFCL